VFASTLCIDGEHHDSRGIHCSHVNALTHL
jgi:hypothetical protein